MDIYIQSLATGGFLGDDLRWSPDLSQAHLFHSTLEALEFCTANQLNDVRLVLRFDGDERYDLNLPVPETPSPRLDAS
jgi:hypothetical protein